MALESETLIVSSLSAIFAFGAMAASFLQFSAQRTHNRKSVTPHIKSDKQFNGGIPFKWIIKNSGLGPAKIKSFTVQVGSKELLFPTIVDFFNATEELGVKKIENYFLFDKGEYIEPGVELVLFELNAILLKDYEPLMRQIQWRVTYESIYGDEFHGVLLAIP